MTFRTKLLMVTSLTVAGAVALVTGVVSLSSRQAFERIDEDRRRGLLDQFQRELDAQGRDVASRVERAAASPPMLRIAIEAAADLEEAHTQAEAQALDFLDILQPDATIVSSAHSPARFGYKSNWLISPADLTGSVPFLTRIPLQEGTAIALAAVRPVSAGDRKIFLIGARRLGPEFLAGLSIAPGMRVSFWQAGDANLPKGLEPLLAQVARTRRQANSTAGAESFVAIPLTHGAEFLGALLVGSSLQEQIWLERSILKTGLLVGSSGVLLGVLIGWWTTARITRPVAQLVSGVRAVAGGNWDARVTVSSGDEIGQLAHAFNQMTGQLVEQRDRAIQAERVAAWRELARRLAHELKNPLFPLQITIENLRNARQHGSSEFEEVFEESTATLLEEVQHLKTIIAQFSDFAKMPQPEIESVDANAAVRDVMKLFDSQFRAGGQPRIDPVLELANGDLKLQADPLQLSRALRNLILNAMDAMPGGGTLRIRTERHAGLVRIQVSDSGQGLTAEECARLFTPYYTTRRHGTGLGLAIVQSVVSDHRGKISVSAEPGRGATFTIDLPLDRTTGGEP